MNSENYSKDMFESIPDYRKIVLLIILIKNAKDFLKEVGFSENEFNHLYLECKNNLLEQHEEYSVYVKNEEESIVERFLNK